MNSDSLIKIAISSSVITNNTQGLSIHGSFESI